MHNFMNYNGFDISTPHASIYIVTDNSLSGKSDSTNSILLLA